jgi:hypothetical protein
MNDVVDCIRISPPKGMQRAVGKKMTWDKLPPFETGTSVIDLSLMTEDPFVEDGYYCTVSVINGTDENGRSLSAEFSVKAGKDEDDQEYSGWSIKQGIRQTDGSYKVDGKSATLLLGADVDGDCEIIARDGKTELRKKVLIEKTYCLLCGNDKYVKLDDSFKPTVKQVAIADPFDSFVYSGFVKKVGTVTTVIDAYVGAPYITYHWGGITMAGDGKWWWFTRYAWDTWKRRVTTTDWSIEVNGVVVDSGTTVEDTGYVLRRHDEYGLGISWSVEYTVAPCTSVPPTIDPNSVGTFVTPLSVNLQSIYLRDSLYCYVDGENRCGSSSLLDIIDKRVVVTEKNDEFYLESHTESYEMVDGIPVVVDGELVIIVSDQTYHFVKADDSIITLDSTNNTITVGDEEVEVYYDNLYWG